MMILLVLRLTMMDPEDAIEKLKMWLVEIILDGNFLKHLFSKEL